jgi:uncharacterized protein
MKIFTKKISESGTLYKDELKLDAFESNGDELKFVKPIVFEGELKKGNDFVEVNGNIKLEYSVSCHLCGNEFIRNDCIGIFEIYRREPTEDEYLLSGDEIELDDMIMDNLRLNLPVRFLCKEDCKGVCTKCGKNLNDGECECVPEEKSSPFDILKDKFNNR